MNQDDVPIDDNVGTIFLIFDQSRRKPDAFIAACYTHEKAQYYCDKMRKDFGHEGYIIKEAEIS